MVDKYSEIKYGYGCPQFQQREKVKAMVILEFTKTSTPDDKYYFVGRSVKAIRKDARFLRHNASDKYRAISIEEARELDLGLLDVGIKAIRRGPTKSFRLASPSKQAC